jgi:2-polyprenyl-3-methyl-5-hydroxy-6-metoxy-1,4-benzoquinol methylase
MNAVANTVKLRTFNLISPDYQATQVELHRRPEGYGGKGARWVSTVLDIRQRYRCDSVLDYGCGQGKLGDAMELAGVRRCREYDPAIFGKDGTPYFADLVVCTDVLEHVEPEYLDRVLSHIRLLARKAVFVAINTEPSNKTLSDGRNAHLIVQPRAWWKATMGLAEFTLEAPLDIHEERISPKIWAAVLKP